jgi:integrase
MPIHSAKQAGSYVYEFDRYIGGARVRTRKRLPKAWSRAQADAFDRQESARLYALATGVERDRATIEQAVELYLADKHANKTIEATASELGVVYWAFRGRFLEELPDVAREITRHHASAGFKPATARNRIAYLRSACRWAWKQHNICEHDPGGRVQMPAVRNERSNFLTRGEALRAARLIPNRAARAAMLIAFYSGMRVGEVIRAKAVDGVWIVRDTKNGDDAHIPVMPKVAVYSRNWPRKLARITAQSSARKALDAIGRPDASFHTLRHSTATAILAAGESLDMVGDILRHKDKRSTQRYAHRQLQDMARAMGGLGKKSPNTPAKRSA